MALPVIKVTFPPDLTGAANGRLPAELLVAVKFPGRGTGNLHFQAARAWWALVNACQVATGVTLTVTSLGDAYRTFVQQHNGFVSRYEPVSYATYLLTSSKRRRVYVWGGHKYWRLRAGLAPMATPGTSNHGWAIALDMCELMSNGTLLGISGSRAWPWLKQNLTRFGFSWEYTSEGVEDWHIRLVVGNNPTQAVLDFEAGHGGGGAPSPLPPFNPERGEFGLWPLADNKPRLGVGSTGDPVRYLQGVLDKVFGGIAVDGQFGNLTLAAVKRYQQERGLTVDGWVGAQTWGRIDQDAVASTTPTPPPPPPPPPPPLPPFDPANALWGLWPVHPSKPFLLPGDRGDAVAYLQGVILHEAGGRITVDGVFGPQTTVRVGELQQYFGIKEIGVRTETWRLVDHLATH